MNGWIKLHRELIDKPIWRCSTLEQRTILITLLCMANHAPGEWEWEGERYTVQPGQLITSVKNIVAMCACRSITTKKVRYALDRFEKYGFLANRTSSKNTLITIINWAKYQNETDTENEEMANQWQTDGKQMSNEGQTNVKPLANDWQTNGKRLATNKNDKNKENVDNDKNDKNAEKDKKAAPASDIDRVKKTWNNLTLYGIRPVMQLNDRRYICLKTLIDRYGIDNVLKAIENIHDSPFLQGKTGRFFITFDWFIKDENFIKVLEGNYNDIPEEPKEHTDSYIDFLRDIQERRLERGG